jgi:hypothetical protein
MPTITQYMEANRYCALCQKNVEIIGLIPYDDHDIQKLSCGHNGKYIQRARQTLFYSNNNRPYSQSFGHHNP